MNPMLAFQQIIDYQSERKRTSIAAEDVDIRLTNDGSCSAQDIDYTTFQAPGLQTYVITNGMAGSQILDTFQVVKPAASDFNLQRALKNPNGNWFLREVRVNAADELELVFLRNESYRLMHEGVQENDLQIVKINDKCDTLLAMFTAADTRAWLVSLNWTRTDGRMLLRIWRLQDGYKRYLYEKEGSVDGDEFLGVKQDWLVTCYCPPALLG